MIENQPGAFAFQIEVVDFYKYSGDALAALEKQEIDNIINEEHKKLREQLILPNKVMLFKAAKEEKSFQNSILGPYKYPLSKHMFS